MQETVCLHLLQILLPIWLQLRQKKRLSAPKPLCNFWQIKVYANLSFTKIGNNFSICFSGLSQARKISFILEQAKILPTMQTWSLSDPCAICTHTTTRFSFFCIFQPNKKFNIFKVNESKIHMSQNGGRRKLQTHKKWHKKLESRNYKNIYKKTHPWGEICLRMSVNCNCGVWVKEKKYQKWLCEGKTWANLLFFFRLVDDSLRKFANISPGVSLCSPLQANKTRLSYDFQSDKNCKMNFSNRECRFSTPTLSVFKNPL